MITELMREEMRDYILKYYGKDKKKFKQTRLIMGALFALVAAMFILYMQKYMFLFIVLVVFFVGYKYPYFTMYNQKQKDDYLNSYLFPEFLQSFIALIPTSANVYQTLIETVPYTRKPLQAQVELLIKNIEENNSRDHYLKFAEYVGSSEAYMIMDMIYQFSEFGIKKEAIKELEDYITEIQKNRVDALIEKKVGSMEFLGFLPIFISLITILGFAVAVMIHYLGGVTGSISNIGM